MKPTLSRPVSDEPHSTLPDLNGSVARAAGFSRSRRGLQVSLGLLAVLGLGGCGQKGIAGELQVFKDGSRKVSEFSDFDATAVKAKKCQIGTIDNVSALLCEYASPEAATLGQAAAEAWFGETDTALVLRRELLLLALSDRDHVDPNGKTMSVIGKLFRRVSKR